MNEKLIEIHKRLIECNLGSSVRVSISGDNWLEFNSIICFLLTADRFESIQELENRVTNCLKGLNFKILRINTGALIISPQ